MRSIRFAAAPLVLTLLAQSLAACGPGGLVGSPKSTAYAGADEAVLEGAPTAARPAAMSARPAPFASPSPTTQVGSPPPQLSAGAATPMAPSASGLAISASEPTGTEGYRDYGVNPVTDPKVDRLSTFAVDVDTASYAIARRKLLRENTLPPYAAVRAEEFLNYFSYDYAPPKTGRFVVHLAGAPSPYEPGHHFLRVAVQGRKVAPAGRAPVHLVYLVDVSGSMNAPDRLGYAKEGLRMLTSTLKPGDTVAISTYAGGVREVLPPTGISERARILEAIDSLSAGGSTAMASGIQLAYDLASRTAQKGHVSRVVVLSDGDANVGASSPEAVVELIKRYRGRGITLSTVGFGSGNYKDVMMERLADAGDGNYAYVDSLPQLRRVFAEQVDGMLQVIARDVKVQVEFDPSVVKQYRLVGYENRDVADKDFRDDKVDAGEIGAGHAVTALYDVVLSRTDASPIVVRVRSKAPETQRDAGGRTLEQAEEESFRMSPKEIAARFDDAPASLRFQTAVVGLAELLRHGPAAREWRFSDVDRIALASAEGKPERLKFSELVRAAARLSGRPIGDAIAR